VPAVYLPPPSTQSPHPLIKRYHLGIFFPLSQTDALSSSPQVKSRSGPTAKEEEQRGMLYGKESHLSRVLQDTLTTHLVLSNSSVSVTDEPILCCRSGGWLSSCAAIRESLVMICSAGHTSCIMYQVFNGRKMGWIHRRSE